MTPLSTQFKLRDVSGEMSEEERSLMNKIPYANIMGSIMYAMVCTRPDLSYVVSLLSRLMGNSSKVHWHALKWVLRYINGTLGKGLVFGGHIGSWKDDGIVVGCVDSDFAGCLDSRKSLTGYVFTSYGTAISWKACLQKVVALSSTKVEYMALIEAIREALWFLALVKELKIDEQQISVFCDNQGAIQLSKN